jgi:hypothetical protein
MHAQKVQPKTFEIFSWQWALGSKKANKREHMAKIRHQQAEGSKAQSAKRLISAE